MARTLDERARNYLDSKMTYAEKLRDSRWQEKRLLVMNRDGFRCRNCDAKEGATLNVHHVYYLKGKAPWEYPDEALWTICEDCHKDFERMRREYEWAASFINPKRYSLFCVMASSLANLLSGETAGQIQESAYLTARMADILQENFPSVLPPNRRGIDDEPENKKPPAEVLREIELNIKQARGRGRMDVAAGLEQLASCVRLEMEVQQ